MSREPTDNVAEKQDAGGCDTYHSVKDFHLRTGCKFEENIRHSGITHSKKQVTRMTFLNHSLTRFIGAVCIRTWFESSNKKPEFISQQVRNVSTANYLHTDILQKVETVCLDTTWKKIFFRICQQCMKTGENFSLPKDRVYVKVVHTTRSQQNQRVPDVSVASHFHSILVESSMSCPIIWKLLSKPSDVARNQRIRNVCISLVLRYSRACDPPANSLHSWKPPVKYLNFKINKKKKRHPWVQLGSPVSPCQRLDLHQLRKPGDLRWQTLEIA